MYRSNRRWKEKDELFSPAWLEELFSLQPDGEQSPKLDPPLPEETKDPQQEYCDLVQRTQTDFINYKHRVEREREEQTKFAHRELILKLLPVLDDLERALGDIPREVADDNWVKGVSLIQRKLTAILEEEGVNRIDAQGVEVTLKGRKAR